MKLLRLRSKSKWSSSLNSTGCPRYVANARVSATRAAMRSGASRPLPCRRMKSDASMIASVGDGARVPAIISARRRALQVQPDGREAVGAIVGQRRDRFVGVAFGVPFSGVGTGPQLPGQGVQVVERAVGHAAVEQQPLDAHAAPDPPGMDRTPVDGPVAAGGPDGGHDARRRPRGGAEPALATPCAGSFFGAVGVAVMSGLRAPGRRRDTPLRDSRPRRAGARCGKHRQTRFR